jgi:hypothetical protein
MKLNKLFIPDPKDLILPSEAEYINALQGIKKDQFEEIRILSTNLKYLKEERSRTYRSIQLRFILLLFPLTVLIFGFFRAFVLPVWVHALCWVILGALIIIVISGLINYKNNKRSIKETEEYINTLMGFSQTHTPSEYFSKLIEINVNNLEKYYKQVKTHTSLSFTFSLVVGLLGFGLIVTGVSNGIINDVSKDYITYISTASGIIIEFIAGVFFYLYNRTVRQLAEYHDKLIEVQNILVSFQLIDIVKDDEKKNAIIENMVEYLVGRREKLADNH